MKKVVIITECRRWRFNYGETLQAVALNRVISDLGIDCVTASYEDQRQGPKWVVQNAKKYAVRGIKFEIFRRHNIKNPILRSNRRKDFLKIIKRSDAVVCGSDCVWYEKCYNDIFFLHFPETNTLKIAYAPSLRDDIITKPEYKQRVSKWIKGITYLSTREKAGSKIIEEISGRKCETVLDPTLICKKVSWDQMSSERVIKEPYVVMYILGKSREVSPIIRQIRKQYNHCKLIWVGMENNNGYLMGEALWDIGPAEFISLIKYADAVVTDSFHGTAFSIIYEKPVYSVKRVVNRNDIYDHDCRIKNFFEILGIQHNYYEIGERIDFISSQIDYTKVREKLEEERNHSLRYLINALKVEGMSQKNEKL